MSNKKTRRALKRMAERKGITYADAIKRHYKVSDLKKINKSLVYSLHKNT